MEVKRWRHSVATCNKITVLILFDFFDVLCETKLAKTFDNWVK